MAEGYKFNYFLLCDDIRKEANGKEILIGVYHDVLICPSFPAQLMQLHFRISLRLERTDFKLVNIIIRGPDEKDLLSTSGPIPQQRTEYQTIFDIGVVGVTFPSTGAYSVLLGLDRKPEVVAKFSLRLPENDEERQRASLR